MRGADRLQRVLDSARKRFAAGSIILLYHRVTTLRNDPEMLAVSPENFAQHLEFLRSNAHTVSLQDLGYRQDGSQQNVAVTFDDGYVDNLHEAKPLLEHYEIPATVFVTSGYIGGNREFWWDELEHIFLESRRLPHRFSMNIAEKNYDWLCTESSRRDIYDRASAMMKRLSPIERERVLSDVRIWAGQRQNCRETHKPLDSGELRQLQEGDLIEIGSHTQCHPVLSTLDLSAQSDQICSGKSSLEKLLARPIRSFAYPFGKRADYNRHSVTAVRNAGIDIACSNFEGLVWPATSRLELPRMLVRDWDGEAFARKYREWTS
jgi:peptidoglycan/xylan/chitin deacetylase (PgdA/CDA1 family)